MKKNEVLKQNDFSDWKNIKSYEDACKALSEEPIVFDKSTPSHIVSLMKLETISRALWGKVFQPQPDGEGSHIYYFPWLVLFTKGEVENMDDDDKRALLSAYAHSGTSAGFGSLDTNVRSSGADADIGFRLCQETEEKARHLGGRDFVKLWADYLLINVEVGDFIIK